MKSLSKLILGLFFVVTLPTTLSAQADGADVLVGASESGTESASSFRAGILGAVDVFCYNPVRN